MYFLGEASHIKLMKLFPAIVAPFSFTHSSSY